MVFSLTMDCFASLSIPEMVRAFIIWLIFITLIFFFFFLNIYLTYFKCYPLFCFTKQKTHLSYLPSSCPLTPPLQVPYSTTLGHRAFSGPQTYLLVDIQQGHPILPIYLEPWVLPWVLFSYMRFLCYVFHLSE